MGTLTASTSVSANIHTIGSGAAGGPEGGTAAPEAEATSSSTACISRQRSYNPTSNGAGGRDRDREAAAAAGVAPQGSVKGSKSVSKTRAGVRYSQSISSPKRSFNREGLMQRVLRGGRATHSRSNAADGEESALPPPSAEKKLSTASGPKKISVSTLQVNVPGAYKQRANSETENSLFQDVALLDIHRASSAEKINVQPPPLASKLTKSATVKKRTKSKRVHPVSRLLLFGSSSRSSDEHNKSAAQDPAQAAAHAAKDTSRPHSPQAARAAGATGSGAGGSASGAGGGGGPPEPLPAAHAATASTSAAAGSAAAASASAPVSKTTSKAQLKKSESNATAPKATKVRTRRGFFDSLWAWRNKDKAARKPAAAPSPLLPGSPSFWTEATAPALESPLTPVEVLLEADRIEELESTRLGYEQFRPWSSADSTTRRNSSTFADVQPIVRAVRDYRSDKVDEAAVSAGEPVLVRFADAGSHY